MRNIGMDGYFDLEIGDIFDVWHNAFEIIECLFKNDDIKNNFHDSLKFICTFTDASSIQVFEYEMESEKMLNYDGYPKKNGKVTDYYHDGLLNDDIDELKIFTNNNCYIILLKEMGFINQIEKQKYLRVLERVFKIIFENIELRERIIKTSYTDGLTKIGNRLYYVDYLKKMYAEGNIPVTVSLIDLFRLKYVNDNYGHTYGDYYIIKAAELLKAILEPDEMLFRTGGDEFVIVSKNLKKDNMSDRLEKVNEQLSNENFGLDIPFPLSINYGVVEGNREYESMFQEADRLMDEHKSKVYVKLKIDRRK